MDKITPSGSNQHFQPLHPQFVIPYCRCYEQVSNLYRGYYDNLEPPRLTDNSLENAMQ